MSDEYSGLLLPKSLDDIDAAFMTQVLRKSGVISATNEVVAQQEKDVGMTAGYFSALKKVKCTYKEATDAPDSFVVKTWPPFEMLPKPAIQAMFAKDVKSYSFPAADFFPRPKTYLADFDAASDRWALIMEDADTFAEHKVHEHELSLDEVLKMIPRLVDVAVAWEGCHEGAKAQQLAEVGVDFWASDANIALYKHVMPAGAKLFDKLMTIEGSSIVGTPTWDHCFGAADISQLFTRKLGNFFKNALPEYGATCTLCHGDLRGDNIFFCDSHPVHKDGWLCIDFQLLFRGPVPSDLAYLMSSGSVLPEVYTGDNRQKILRTFYDLFMTKTKIYKDYTYEKFEQEFAMMTTVLFVYYVGMGAAIWQASAFKNVLEARVELGGQGVTEADLNPTELRKRMWWMKTCANFRENFKSFDQYRHLQSVPDSLDGLSPWVELPEHLR